nr:hypothetical protein [Pantoea cypripedii]
MFKKDDISFEVPLLALVTAVVYFMSYAYQSGYAYFYGYSIGFQTLDLNFILDSFFPITYSVLISIVGIFIVKTIEPFKHSFKLLILLYIAISSPVSILIVNGGVFGWVYESGVYFRLFAINAFILVGMFIPQTIGIYSKLGLKAPIFYIFSSSVMIIFMSFPLGTVSAASQEYLFKKRGEDIYLLTSVGGLYVLGQCDKEDVHYEILKNDESVQLVRVYDLNEIHKVKNCFYYHSHEKQGNTITPIFKVHKYQ